MDNHASKQTICSECGSNMSLWCDNDIKERTEAKAYWENEALRLLGWIKYFGFEHKVNKGQEPPLLDCG